MLRKETRRIDIDRRKRKNYWKHTYKYKWNNAVISSQNWEKHYCTKCAYYEFCFVKEE